MYSFGRLATCPYCGVQNLLGQDAPSWVEGRYSHARVCPVCRGDGSLVRNRKRTLWRCLSCGYRIPEKQLETEIFWFCDACDAFLNVQPGFDPAAESWVCRQCGYGNDISEDNLFE